MIHTSPTTTMVTMTALSVSKLRMRRKSEKARLETATNLEDTSRGLVLPAQPAERIRPSHGGLVQYYSPDDVGRSSSTSSISDLSSVTSTPTSACSQCHHCKQQTRKSNTASTKKSSFSWKSGWHPDRKDEGYENWRGGWPGSEHISEWRAPLKPAERVLSSSSSASSTSDSALFFGTARSHVSIESRTQPLSDALSTSDIDPSYFVGCQQVMPESPISSYLTGWDRFPSTVEPPPYEPIQRHELE
jgi:hypothetical protein